MDLFNETRSLVHFGPVLRRGRSDTGLTSAWSELVAALLDNYCKHPQTSGSAFRYLILSSFFFCSFTHARRETSKWSRQTDNRVAGAFLIYFFFTLPFNSHACLQPIPLSYLRLGTFDSPPDTRREKVEDGGLLESLRYQTVHIYPFTVYHASDRSKRYTLYVSTDGIRQRWYTEFVDAIGVHKVWQDANMVSC